MTLVILTWLAVGFHMTVVFSRCCCILQVLLYITGAVVSLAWLAIGFNLAAVNSPAITVHEKSNADSHCAAYA